MRRGLDAVRQQPPERGATVVETAILLPVLLAIIFGLIQGALWYHARHVALGAAQQGARAAAAEGGGDGVAVAYAFVDQLTSSALIDNLTVNQSATATTVTVTVTGQAPALLPGVGGVATSQSATVPIERVTTPGG